MLAIPRPFPLAPRLSPGHIGEVRGLLLTISLTALACAPADEGRLAPAATTTATWEPTPPPETRLDPDAPFDPRLVRMEPDQHVDQERVCDVVLRGEEEVLRGLRARAYTPPMRRRLSVRCRAASGTAWADLVFPEASENLAEFVDVGQRLRVRVRPGSGLRGMPVLEFLTTIGEGVGGDTEAEALVRVAAVGADWAQVGVPGGTPLPCAIASVGLPEPVPEDGGYGPEITHRLRVACLGGSGRSYVDVAFPAALQRAALRLRRGDIVPLVPVARTGAGWVRARYAGP